MKKEFLSLINEYLDYLLLIRGYSEATVKTYRKVLLKAIEYADIKLQDDRYIIDIISLRVELASKSTRTISKYLSGIRSYIKWLKKTKGYKITLLSDENVKLPSPLPKALDKNYIDELLSVADIRQKAIISLLYGAGLRISELASLKLEDISSEWISVMGKGAKERQIPIPPSVYNSIKAYIDAYNPTIWLFEKNGKAMQTHQIRYILQKLFKSQGIKATPHQLRHSFATEVLDRGARLTDVRKLLGHESIVTTQIYTKLSNSKKMREYMNSHPLADNTNYN